MQPSAGKPAVSPAARIETMAYQTTFDRGSGGGTVPVNVSVFRSGDFDKALPVLRKAFGSVFSFSELAAVAEPGEELEGVVVPAGSVGLATVSSILVKGVLLKIGVPARPRFAGILEVKKRRAVRFVDLIEYAGSSLDPAEVFIAGKMGTVGEAVATGSGKIMASLWEIPAPARADTEHAVEGLRRWGMKGLVVLGMVSAPVCEMPVSEYRCGIVIADGLNPVAAATEAGIECVSHTMAGVIDRDRLRSMLRYRRRETR